MAANPSAKGGICQVAPANRDFAQEAEKNRSMPSQQKGKQEGLQTKQPGQLPAQQRPQPPPPQQQQQGRPQFPTQVAGAMAVRAGGPSMIGVAHPQIALQGHHPTPIRGPPHANISAPLPYRQPRPTVENVDLTLERMTPGQARSILTTFQVFRLEQNPDREGTDEFGYPLPVSWSSVRRYRVDDRPHDQVKREIARLNADGPLAAKQRKLIESQLRQLELCVEALNELETDPLYIWRLAQFDRKTHRVPREPSRDRHDSRYERRFADDDDDRHDSRHRHGKKGTKEHRVKYKEYRGAKAHFYPADSTGKRISRKDTVKKTAHITVYCRRTPRDDVDAVELLRQLQDEQSQHDQLQLPQYPHSSGVSSQAMVQANYWYEYEQHLMLTAQKEEQEQKRRQREDDLRLAHQQRMHEQQLNQQQLATKMLAATLQQQLELQQRQLAALPAPAATRKAIEGAKVASKKEVSKPKAKEGKDGKEPPNVKKAAIAGKKSGKPEASQAVGKHAAILPRESAGSFTEATVDSDEEADGNDSASWQSDSSSVSSLGDQEDDGKASYYGRGALQPARKTHRDQHHRLGDDVPRRLGAGDYHPHELYQPHREEQRHTSRSTSALLPPPPPPPPPAQQSQTQSQPVGLPPQVTIVLPQSNRRGRSPAQSSFTEDSYAGDHSAAVAPRVYRPRSAEPPRVVQPQSSVRFLPPPAPSAVDEEEEQQYLHRRVSAAFATGASASAAAEQQHQQLQVRQQRHHHRRRQQQQYQHQHVDYYPADYHQEHSSRGYATVSVGGATPRRGSSPAHHHQTPYPPGSGLMPAAPAPPPPPGMWDAFSEGDDWVSTSDDTSGIAGYAPERAVYHGERIHH